MYDLSGQKASITVSFVIDCIVMWGDMFPILLDSGGSSVIVQFIVFLAYFSNSCKPRENGTFENGAKVWPVGTGISGTAAQRGISFKLLFLFLLSIALNSQMDYNVGRYFTLATYLTVIIS